MSKQLKLDPSWENSVSDWNGNQSAIYLLGVSKFQEKALLALSKEYDRLNKLADPATPYFYDQRNGIGEAIEIIKKLKS